MIFEYSCIIFKAFKLEYVASVLASGLSFNRASLVVDRKI